MDITLQGQLIVSRANLIAIVILTEEMLAVALLQDRKDMTETIEDCAEISISEQA